MEDPSGLDSKMVRRIIDLYVRLQESLRADGYGQDAIEELSIVDVVALTHGRLQEPDGTVVLPTVRDVAPSARPQVSHESKALMLSLVDTLNQASLLMESGLVVDVVNTIAWRA